MKSISEYLEEDRIKWSTRPYLTVKNGTWQTRTFRQVIDQIQDLSRGLLLHGFQNKNIMIFSENSYEWILLYLGIMGYVGTCVPVDKDWTPYDLNHTLSVLDTAAVFYSRFRSGCIDSLREHYPDTAWFCIEDSLESLMEAGHRSGPALAGRTDLTETALILFTSGTTNLPKAIPLTQENLFANWETLYRRTPMTAADRSFVFLPLHHVYTCVANVLYTIVSGMELWLNSGFLFLISELIEARPTVVCTVPLILYRMKEAMTEELLETLRAVRWLYCGGSFTDPAVKEYFIQNDISLLEAYGTTETSSVIALSIPGDPNTASNGTVFENLDVRIDCPDEEGIGEIVVRGKSVSKGYLHRNDRYSEFDAEGAYHTGDLGILDEHGHLYLKGRKKRMILTANGKNIYVEELEALLLEDPRIKTAKVYEESFHPAAFVTANLPEADVQALLESINQKLPPFKQIRTIHIRPDTEGGRIK